jgi:hypothetical protein
LMEKRFIVHKLQNFLCKFLWEILLPKTCCSKNKSCSEGSEFKPQYCQNGVGESSSVFGLLQ